MLVLRRAGHFGSQGPTRGTGGSGSRCSQRRVDWSNSLSAAALTSPPAEHRKGSGQTKTIRWDPEINKEQEEFHDLVFIVAYFPQVSR